ncbi:helix-turn-helix domain-containing protein [Arenibacter latericius]|uniref:helix-turn-helix domain-containing protein n=1 Tax=Arenibacter latericius TaxID=86104 RepID=UPI00040645A9|nr:helix-turn-helix domain-containing protein [Arenibacter latericius]
MDLNTTERIVINLQEYDVKRGLSFGHYRYNEVKPGLESHQHQGALEICYCMKGLQHYKIGDNMYELKGDDIIVVPPNTVHSTGEYPEDKGELFWIQILINPSHGKLCNLPNLHSEFLLKELLERSEYIFKGAFQLKLILERLVLLFKKEDSILTRIMVNQLITELLLETVLLSQKKMQLSPSKKINILNSYIVQNLHRIIYVDELAEIVSMSTGYFKAWFKEKTGMPPKEYVNRLKIEQAKVDLQNSNSITKVAFDLGFSSSQYFATTFKKFTGYTPSSFINS